jgi:hypothetical protein
VRAGGAALGHEGCACQGHQFQKVTSVQGGLLIVGSDQR